MVAFEIVVVVVCVVSAVIAAAAFLRAWRLYDRIGRSGAYSMTPAAELDDSTREVVRQEVREVMNAISALRGARGEAPTRIELADEQAPARGDEHAPGQLELDADPERAQRQPSARGA